MKRLLLVSYFFPPLLSPESILASRTVKALSKFQWDITVLTVKEETSLELIDRHLLDFVPNSVKIVRSPTKERFLFSIPLISSPLLKIMRSMGLPDVGFPWFFPALRAGKHLLQSGQFEVIYSRACYHTSNIVGLVLKRATGLPWLAHFSDPWVDNPFITNSNTTLMQRKIARWLEKSVIQEADAIVFITQTAADLVMRKYPLALKDKVHVIPHGYDADILESLDISPVVNKKLRLVYLGSFYPGLRTPDGLFRGLKLLSQSFPLENQLEVVLIGPYAQSYQSAADKMGLGKVVEFREALPFVESLREAAKADALLLIDAPNANSSIFLPSKLIDYLILKKPILGLTPPRGASADLLRRLGCPVVPPDNAGAIATAMTELIQQWRSGRMEVSSAFDQVAGEYDIRRTTNYLDKALRRII